MNACSCGCDSCNGPALWNPKTAHCGGPNCINYGCDVKGCQEPARVSIAHGRVRVCVYHSQEHRLMTEVKFDA